VPIGSSGLPVTQAAADQAQLLKALQQAQERSLNQVEAGRSQERGKEAASSQVQGAEEVSGATIQGESRGAHSFTLSKDEEEEPPKEEAKAETPPDPDGKGSRLDLQG
jgi:hypothetical protein